MGGNNNVIIRIPSKNEHSNILLNSDLNGTIDIATSKLNTWNLMNNGALDFSMFQDNSTYIFNIPSAEKHDAYYLLSYYTMDKSNEQTIYYGWGNYHYTFPCFRPIFEFNQE